MKTKLTLSVESGLIPQAKRYAGEKGISLSQVVEGALRLLADSGTVLPFSKRWRGRFKTVPRASARYRRLAARFQL